MDAKCSACGRHFEVESVSSDLSGCTCPFCGGALAGTPAAKTGSRDAAANAMWILFSTTSLIIAALAICSCFLWVKVQKLEEALYGQTDTADRSEVQALAAETEEVKKESAFLYEALGSMYPREGGEELQKQLSSVFSRLAETEKWQEKYSPALERLGDLASPDNPLDTSFANVFTSIDQLAAREDERYSLLCDQLNAYALSVSNSLGALETDMDTIFAYSSDTAGVIDSLCENIDGMEKDISRLFNRVNDLNDGRRIIFMGRPAPPRIPGRPHHAPRPSRPKSSIVHQKR